MFDFADLAESQGAWVVAVAGCKGRTQSGFHWREGWVFTADHGLNGDDTPAVALPDGKLTQARLVGRDPGTDLALLKLEETLPAPSLRANVNGIRAGEPVLLLARHPDDGLGVSFGIISNRAGEWKTWRGGTVENFLQPDLRLYNGYSGGPLIDLQGRLLGLVTPALSRTAPIALPVPTLERVAAELQNPKPKAYLGVGLHTVKGGAMLTTLEEGGPAESAGLLLGDILQEVNGQEVAGLEDTLAVLATLAADIVIKVALVRAGQRQELEVRTGQRARKGS